jgi:hypothetical protein
MGFSLLYLDISLTHSLAKIKKTTIVELENLAANTLARKEYF